MLDTLTGAFHYWALRWIIDWFRISIMKKYFLTIGVLGVALVLSWVGAFFIINSERNKSLDILNRLDYTLVSSDDLSKYLQEDVGVTLGELREADPAEGRLRAFPELYLVARAMGSSGNSDIAIKYYGEAEKRLDTYHAKDSVVADFYLLYVSTLGVGSDGLDDLINRANKAIDSTESLSDDDKDMYKRLLQGYTGDGIAVDKEE